MKIKTNIRYLGINGTLINIKRVQILLTGDIWVTFESGEQAHIYLHGTDYTIED